MEILRKITCRGREVERGGGGLLQRIPYNACGSWHGQSGMGGVVLDLRNRVFLEEAVLTKCLIRR